jgi:hypothetical protein
MFKTIGNFIPYIYNSLFAGKNAFASSGEGYIDRTNDAAMARAIREHDVFQCAKNVKTGTTRYEIAYIAYRRGAK